MADLANAAALSASRMTRLVDDLQARGLVTKRTSSVDARGNVAKLTPAGLAQAEASLAGHLASVRAGCSTTSTPHVDERRRRCRRSPLN